MDINCKKFVSDWKSGSIDLSLRLDVFIQSIPKYIVVENTSDTEQTVEIAEAEIESVNLNEEFEIDWKSGEG